MTEQKYPECEKLASVSEESQKIGAFLSWLQGKGIILAVWDKYEGMEQLMQYGSNINSILADYFDIDLGKVEDERGQILDNIRNQN